MRESSRTLRDKVNALSTPYTYRRIDRNSQTVTTIETHMSWVFLTKNFAFKLKKPTFRPPLDFRTSALRRIHCEAEITLNRRLSKNVYLKTLPLLETARKSIELSGEGESIDWLVWTRRLEADACLEHMIRNNKINQISNIDQIIIKISEFIRRAEVIKTSPEAYLKDLFAHTYRISSGLISLDLNLDNEKISRFNAVLNYYLKANSQAFSRRASSGCIIHGHGDLRPEHIFIEDEVQIIDCLEFCRDLRCLDLVDDLCLLMIECQRLNAYDLGEAILHGCLKTIHDHSGAELICFYSALKSLQRGLLAGLHLVNKVSPSSDYVKWRSRTNSYIDVAEHWIKRL